MPEEPTARSDTPPAPQADLQVTAHEAREATASRPLLRSFETESATSSISAASGAANGGRRGASSDAGRGRLNFGGIMSGTMSGGERRGGADATPPAQPLTSGSTHETDTLVPPPLVAAATRVYHGLFRERPPRSGTATPDLAEPLNPPGLLEIRSAFGSDAGSERSGLVIRPHMSRAASHRSLTHIDQDAVRESWERQRNWFVLWLSAALVSLIVSWWWFPLGVLVGGLGVLGSVSALRHKTGVELVQPAKGVQYLGVLTGLLAAAAAGSCVIALASVRCAKAENCGRLRLTLVIVALWFATMALISGLAAKFAYGLIQRLEPTFYWRQSEVGPELEPDEHNLGVVVQQEVVTPTPRAAAARSGSLNYESLSAAARQGSLAHESV